MTEFFSWELLATFAGCAAGTAVITQFLKNIGFLKNVATQWISYGIALVLLFAATYFTGGLTASAAAIIPFNAIAIALSANGAFSAIDRVTSSTSDTNAATDTSVTLNGTKTEPTNTEVK